jgi:hypothetical protein
LKSRLTKNPMLFRSRKFQKNLEPLLIKVGRSPCTPATIKTSVPLRKLSSRVWWTSLKSRWTRMSFWRGSLNIVQNTTVQRGKQADSPAKMRNKRKLGFLFLWSICWLGFSIPSFFTKRSELGDLINAYQTADFKTTEGVVRVMRTQPAQGHSPGDLISINDVMFDINYFVSTQAYH